jgi:hypothetical protein
MKNEINSHASTSDTAPPRQRIPDPDSISQDHLNVEQQRQPPHAAIVPRAYYVGELDRGLADRDVKETRR